MRKKNYENIFIGGKQRWLEKRVLKIIVLLLIGKKRQYYSPRKK